MKRMQKRIARFACALVALAMLIWPCAPVRAEYFGTLRQDQDWVINADNSSSNGPSTISVSFLNKKNNISDDFEFTLPGGGRAQFPFEKVGRDVKRIIIYGDPPKGGTVIIEVAQNNSNVETCAGDCRLVLNVE